MEHKKLREYAIALCVVPVGIVYAMFMYNVIAVVVFLGVILVGVGGVGMIAWLLWHEVFGGRRR